jgi:hypothetical protein
LKHFVKSIVAGCISIAVLVSVPMLAPSVQAAEAGAKEKPQKTRRVPSMSESVYKKLSEGQEAIDAKDYNLSIDVLRKMLERSKRYNGNEIGQVHSMLGYIYFLKEDYKSAVREYKLVVAQGDEVPEGLEQTTLYTLAQLTFVEGEYDDSLKFMELFISKANNPGPEPRIFMGQVYYQMKDYPKAIGQMLAGINMARERGLTVKENWWQLINFLYYEQENMPKVIETLEILVRDFPKRDYWVRLAGMYGQENREDLQLNTLQVAYAGDFLEKETDLTNLAGLLMQEEIPYKAAKVLEQGLKDEIIESSSKNLRSLGQAWQLAQEVEKAIPVLQSAAKLSDDGKIFDQLSYVFLEADRYEDCVSSANSALDKGGVRKKQSTYFVRGLCLYNQDKLNEARGSFVSCRNEARKEEDETNTRTCLQWITFIDREKDRQAQLAAAS